MDFWASTFWAPGFWAAGFWATGSPAPATGASVQPFTVAQAGSLFEKTILYGPIQTVPQWGQSVGELARMRRRAEKKAATQQAATARFLLMAALWLDEDPDE